MIVEDVEKIIGNTLIFFYMDLSFLLFANKSFHFFFVRSHFEKHKMKLNFRDLRHHHIYGFDAFVYFFKLKRMEKQQQQE